MGTTTTRVRATVSIRGDMPRTIAPEPQGSDNGKVGAVDEALAREYGSRPGRPIGSPHSTMTGNRWPPRHRALWAGSPATCGCSA
jgi:hypothetical protein